MRPGAPSRHLSCSVQVIFSGLGLSFLASGPSLPSLGFASSLPLAPSLSDFLAGVSSVALGIGLILSSGFLSSVLAGSAALSALGLGGGAFSAASPVLPGMPFPAGPPVPPGSLLSVVTTGLV